VRWRSTGVGNESITLDLGSEKDANTLILLDHNFTENATVAIWGSANNVDYELIHSMSPDGDSIIHYGEIGVFRYFKLTIQDSSNTAGFLEIGVLFLGRHFVMDRNYNYGWKERFVDLTETQRSKGGVIHFNVKPIYREYSLPFQYVLPAAKDKVRDMVQTTGVSTPFFATLDSDENLKGSTVYATLKQIPEFVNAVTTLFDFTLEIMELV
jgi:hypothetical protein